MQGDLHIMEGFHQQSKILQESNPTNDDQQGKGKRKNTRRTKVWVRKNCADKNRFKHLSSEVHIFGAVILYFEMEVKIHFWHVMSR